MRSVPLTGTDEAAVFHARPADGTRPVPGRNGLPTALSARDLWFSYDGRHPVLRGVDLTLERGATAMILGRSGSGKTTLLRVLAGLLPTQRGTITAAENGRHPARHIAYVPQTLGLVRNMTALENTLAGALRSTGTLRSLFRLFPRATVARAKDTLASLGLQEKQHERVYHLSGGERQRVALARALMQEPDLILADEFVSQLDPVTTESIMTMMRDIAGRGVALLITTHETDVVATYADQLIVMRDGTAVFDGRTRDMPRAAMVQLL